MITLAAITTGYGFSITFWTAHIVAVIVTICYIARDNKDPVKALAWITVTALLPVAGILLYVFFGQYHRKEKIFNRKEIKDLEQTERISREQLRIIRESREFAASRIAVHRDIITLLLNNNKSLLTLRNKAEILNNGRHTFASIIEALESARQSIHMEYYIFENDRIGGRIAEIMMEKARNGVEVRFIYDDVGSWHIGRKFLARLREAGVEVQCFMPVAFPFLTSKVNYRNHRKIVVVDGRVAFTGGINIADRYMKRGRRGMWRDTHLKVEGEAANMLQTVFVTDWYFLSKKILNDKKYFPDSTLENEHPIQIVTSGPDSDWAAIMQTYFSAITRAKDHIYITSPYFLPNQAILTALKVAALSGIDVRIMLPNRSDSKIVYWATRSYITEILEAGIKVALYRKGFCHSKLIMIDGSFCSVGTANMDMRSFEDNFEVSAIIYDEHLASQLEGSFFDDLRHCQRLSLTTWEKRPLKDKVYESFARLLSPLL